MFMPLTANMQYVHCRDYSNRGVDAVLQIVLIFFVLMDIGCDEWKVIAAGYCRQ